MQKLLVILGPTATGKTDLAILLAKKFNGEIVSCDSRQVYKGLDIGTGKYPNEKSKLVKIWMYDVVSPKIQYSVADYVKDANRVIEDILKRDKLPVVVGGTGLYLKALLEGLDSLAIPIDRKLRKSLEKLSLNELQEKLQEGSPQRWNRMNQSDRGNPRRLVRAIELSVSPRRSPFGHFRGVSSSYDVLKIGLTTSRTILYKKVDDNVISRIKQGMIEEARKLHKRGLTLQRMKQLGLEYEVLADYLVGKITNKEDLIKIMQYKIHGYVRRQLTWFKKEKNVVWFDIHKKGYLKKLENKVSRWYYQS